MSIELKDVHKSFGQQVVLDGVDFTVETGQTVALLGPSGTGKSVLLKHIVGLLHPDSGQVLVDGMSVPDLNRHDLTMVRRSLASLMSMNASVKAKPSEVARKSHT